MDIKGIIPPLVTPLMADGTLDREGVDRLLEHVIEGGVHGVFILGTTGEGPHLSYDLRRQFIARVTESIGGRIPVIVSISDTSMVESHNLAKYAKEAGASAVAFTPPYYFIPGGPELQDFVQDMVELLCLPFFLYNMPSLTKVTIPLDVIETAFQCENCLGLKDSSGDLFYFKQVRRLIGKRDKKLLIGPEELLAESLLAGGHGGVSGGANLFPRLYVSIYEHMQAGDFAQAAALQREVMELSCGLYNIGRHGSRIIQGIKGALELSGICQRHLAAPFRGLSADELKRASEVISGMEHWLSRPTTA